MHHPMLYGALSVAMLGLVPAPSSADGAARRPNFVLIMADDLGYGDLGYNGGPFKTPHIDQLARQGTRLQQHYSLPVCSPTRSSLLSGRFNSRFGCTSPTNNRVFPFETVTLAAALKSVGYHTALIGKWHLGSKLEWGPQHYGFDYSYGSLAGGVTPDIHLYKEGEFSRTWHRNGKFVDEEGHVTDLLTQEAVRFLETKRDGPFFLYVPYTAVHLPIDEPKKWLDLYADEKDPALRQYGACVSHLDDGVGQIVEALKRTGQLDNTILIFLSDNGATKGTQNFDTKYPGTYPRFAIPGHNGELRGQKGQLYEGGIRTPAFVYGPKLVPAGRQVSAPIHVADWFPTLAALAGYLPKQDLKWDGSDLWPVIVGAKPPTPRPLYFLGPGNAAALRYGDFVLLTFRDKRVELYDLSRDVKQETNLAEQMPAKVRELRAMQERLAQRDLDAQVK